jgi:DNA-binding transcriptional LysR family regulator
MSYNFENSHLEAFRHVIELGSVTRAAERIGISQPAVTNAILRLERRVGFPLFEHGRGRSLPTPEGIQFYEATRGALSGLARLADLAEEIQHNRAGALHLISHPLGATAILPPVIAAFRQAHPNVHVRLQTANSPRLHEMARTQAFDIGLAEPPLDRRFLNMSRHRLSSVCALPPSHRLAQKSVITPQDLSGHPLIVPAQDRPFHHSLRRLFDEAASEWTVAAEVDMSATEGELVLRGLGAAIFDPITASLFKSRGLVVRSFAPALFYEFLIFQPQRPASQVAVAFLVTLKESLRAYEEAGDG